jgi:ribonucleoside-diphosphate reductase alpha chain
MRGNLMSNLYSENAITIYKKLYFNRDRENNLIETTPGQCHDRVAKAISFNEEEYLEFKTMLNQNTFRPNSPVLINAGGPKQYLSACYVLGLEDSMDSIIDCWGTCAKIYASGAGAGIPLTNLRRKDGPITFGGRASGPLSYTKVLDIYSETVKAGNKARRAANMGMIRHDHPDIYELLDCKLDRTTLKNFNLSVTVPDFYMEQVLNNKDFLVSFFDPKEGILLEKSIEGLELWDKIINNVYTIGDPGLMFRDTVNKWNPFPITHPIECTNPCGEVPLWPWSECVIGSINVAEFHSGNNEHSFEWDKFKTVVKWATIFLDNCIEKTLHPHPKFRETMLKYRPIGLGIMGFADLLVKMEIPYDYDKSIALFEKICFELNNQAIRTSIDICKKELKRSIDIPEEDEKHFIDLLLHYTKGNQDIVKDFHEHGIRNCTWTCIAPTGSISISADCSYSFEPLSAIVWQKELAETHKLMTFVNPEFEKWAKEYYNNNNIDSLIEKIIENNGSVQGLKIPKHIQNTFKTAHDISPYDKVNVQAAGQKWISLAISSTCNLPESATPEMISDIYKYAWKQGLKGITVYRDKSQQWQPINFGKKDCDTMKRISPIMINDKIVTDEELIECYVKHRYIKPVINVESGKVKLHYSSTPDFNNKIERPIKRKGETIEIKTPHGRLYCTFNKDDQGRPLEVFLRLGKSGTLENLLLDTISRLISKSLQNNVPYKDISSLLRGIKGDKFWMALVPDVPATSAESIIDAVGILMEEVFYELDYKEKETKHNGYPEPKGVMEIIKYEQCPECNRFSLKRETGCRGGMCTNPECLWTNCN